MQHEEEYDLIEDLHKIDKELLKNKGFAEDLYKALCNIKWCKNGEVRALSWRMAGGVVSGLRNEGEDYLDFYCSGGEGTITEEVGSVLSSLGWKPEWY
jgi:hypothetical protein